MSYEDEMRQVLQAAVDGAPFERMTDAHKCMLKECCDAGYIDGIIYLEMANGRIVAECRYPPRITRAGAAFLSAQDLPETKENLSDQHTEEPPCESSAESDHSLGNFAYLVGVAVVAGVILLMIEIVFHQ